MSRIGFVLLGLLCNVLCVATATADWWEDKNPFRPLTPNWGPLIPHPTNPIELFPICWGRPEYCQQQIREGERQRPPRGVAVKAVLVTTNTPALGAAFLVGRGTVSGIRQAPKSA
jgi:hypothetical protein